MVLKWLQSWYQNFNTTRTIDRWGTIEYRNADGDRHREDGPAMIYPSGNQYWFKNGEIHREDGPAVIYANGNQYWSKNGKFHREDGPAEIYPNGSPILA